MFLYAGSYSNIFSHELPNRTQSKWPFLGIDGTLASIGNDTIVKVEHMLMDNEFKSKANITAAETTALLGELKQRLNITVSIAKSILPASKGEFQRQANEIDKQNMIINQLIKQVNALTPVSGITSHFDVEQHILECAETETPFSPA